MKYRLISLLDKETAKKLYKLRNDLEMKQVFKIAKKNRTKRPSLAA